MKINIIELHSYIQDKLQEQYKNKISSIKSKINEALENSEDKTYLSDDDVYDIAVDSNASFEEVKEEYDNVVKNMYNSNNDDIVNVGYFEESDNEDNLNQIKAELESVLIVNGLEVYIPSSKIVEISDGSEQSLESINKIAQDLIDEIKQSQEQELLDNIQYVMDEYYQGQEAPSFKEFYHEYITQHFEQSFSYDEIKHVYFQKVSDPAQLKMFSNSEIYESFKKLKKNKKVLDIVGENYDWRTRKENKKEINKLNITESKRLEIIVKNKSGNLTRIII